MASSIQPRKQRKARAQAPLHKRRKMMHTHLSKELRQKLGTSRRAAVVRKGDKVKVVVGNLKGKTGTVMEADYSDLVIYVEGLTRKNAKGIEKMIAIQPSNTEIIEGDFSLKDRKAMLERSGKKVSSAPVQKNDEKKIVGEKKN
ncbi:MAG: 50S ribosomal protein L24 [Candidatus Micrarchaeota archaeon]